MDKYAFLTDTESFNEALGIPEKRFNMGKFDSFIAGESTTGESPGQVYIGCDGKVYDSETQTKAAPILTLNAGEALTGEVFADGFFYFELTDINGISKTCRLPVVANGLKIVEEQK